MFALALLVEMPARADTASSLTFRIGGEVREVRSLAQLREISHASEVKVFEPYEAAPVSFQGVPLNSVLDAIYGEGWRTEEEVLLTCRDGYQPSFPVSRLLAYNAWLAFDRNDDKGFSIDKVERGELRRVDLSPFYLVWDNLEDAELRDQGDYGWPYQLVGVDLIKASDRFPNMTPPATSSPQVMTGYQAFRVHCTRCHAINGEGGAIGPELNSPVNPVEFRSHDWLRQWIDDPASLVPTARMPRLNPKLTERDRVIEDLLAYLVEIANHKTNAATSPEDAS